MATFARLFHRIPASRRSYSFFSSNAGGGRHFNPSKSNKSPVVATKSKSDQSSSDRTPKDSPTKAPAPANANPTVNASSTSNNTPSTSKNPKSSEVDTPEPGRDAASGPSLPNSQTVYTHSSPNPSFPTHTHPLSPHPSVNTKDFKIHQFFSLYRPLLLLAQPSSIFEPAPLSVPLFQSSLLEEPEKQKSGEAEEKLPVAPFTDVNLDGTLGYGYSVNVDGDAEAARQLHHTMTMNKLGSVASWEETLKKLGLDMSLDVERVMLREQLDKEWEEVMLDSVKRKRRKKMKKHKLKKRRRDTRAQRMRIGR